MTLVVYKPKNQTSPRPIFNAPLTHNLNLTSGIGVATFTRATTAMVEDHEGLLRLARSGEARFKGARRIENLYSTSEVMTAGTGVTVTANTGLDKDGLYTLDSIVEDSASTEHFAADRAVTPVVGNNYIFSAYIRAGVGDRNFYLRVASGNTANAIFNPSTGATVAASGANLVSSGSISLGGGLYRCWMLINTTSASSTVFRNQLTSGTTTVYLGNGTYSVQIGQCQIESVTGQASKTVGEYVSNGVLSAPSYHGSYADRVKCFNTSISGANISEGLLNGVMTEVGSTNIALHSSNPSNIVYGSVGITIGASISSLDGNIDMAKIVENGALAIHYSYQQMIITANATYTYSRFYKYSGRFIRHSFVSTGSGNGCYCDIDLQNGLIVNSGTVGSGAITNASIQSFSNSIYRVTLTGSIGGGIVTAFAVSTLRNVSTNVTSEAEQQYTGNTTSGVYVWGTQVENLPFASSYIPTTTATVTRNADNLSYPNAGNVLNTKGSVLLSATPDFNIPNSAVLGYGNNYVLDFGTDNGIIRHTSNALFRYDGTTGLSSPAWVPLKNTTYKIGSRYGSVGQKNYLNGTAGTQVSFDGSINSATNMSIGRYGGSLAYWGGTIKNLKIYNNALRDEKIIELQKDFLFDENGSPILDENGLQLFSF